MPVIARMKTVLLAGSILAGLAAAPALAQSAPTDPTQPSSPSEAAASTSTGTATASAPASAPSPQSEQTKRESEVGAIVVTGSRIKRDSFTAPDPVQVITAEQATLSGYADTSSLLQQSAIATGTFQTGDQLTGYVTTGGAGNKTLSLSRLGAQRTIILLDGKRLGPAGVSGTVGPVSLDVIPEFNIERVEVLRDGASSIYGSDAVAGVVNIITKKSRNGGSLSAYTSQALEAGGNRYSLSGAYGRTFSRGYVDLGGEYFEQQRLARGQRDYTNCAEDYVFNPTTGQRLDLVAGGTPNDNHFYKCFNQSNNDIAVSYRAANPVTGVLQSQSATLQYRKDGLTYPTYAQGNDVPATLAGTFARQARAGYPLTYPYGNYTSPYYDRASVVSPDKFYDFNINGGYDLSTTTHLYGSFLFNDRISTQTGVRQYFPGSGAAGNTLNAAFVAGNPNNIFAGTGVTPLYPIISQQSDAHQNVKYYRGVAGIKGDLTGLGWFNRFSYDVYGVYSRSDANYSVDQIYLDRTNALTSSAAPCTTDLTSVGLSNKSNYSCSSLPNGIPLFSSRVLSGQFTQAERDFLFFKAQNTTIYDQYIVEADITGDLFTLPAGMVRTAFGVSYRHDHIDDVPDQQFQIGNVWGSSAAGRTVGSDSVKEVYAELSVPVIKDVPLVKALNFDLSTRYSDYESYGSTTTYKFAGNWTIIPDLRFRGSYGTSFRAPALYELYLAHQTGFSGQSAVDPCYNYGTNNPGPSIVAACRAIGIPDNYVGQQNPGGGGSAIISTGGGIGNLQAETSTAKSIGVIIEPKHFGIDRFAHLQVSLDYIDIQVENQVSTFGSFNIITQCLQGNASFCTLFTRDLNPTSSTYFNILNVNNNYVNVAREGVRFLDADVHMDHDFGNFGRLSLDGRLVWTFSAKTTLLGDSSPYNYNGGTYGNFDDTAGPDFSADFNLRWDRKDWTLFWRTAGIGKGSDVECSINASGACTFYGFDTSTSTRYSTVNPVTGVVSGTPVKYKYNTEATIYHTISLRKKIPSYNAEVTVGVTNLLNEHPPAESTGQFRIGTSAIGYANDLLIGRSFFARLTKKF